MGVAVGSSADAERFSLRRVDPTLRRLRAPLSGATPQVRRYAALGATRRVGVAVRPFCRWGRRGAAAPGRQPYIGRGHRRGGAIWPLGASRVRLLRGGSPTWAAGAMRVAVRAVRAGSADAPPALNGIWRLNI